MSGVDYEVRDGYLYTKGDTWVRQESSGIFRMGITDYAQKKLKEIEYLNLPQEGDAVEQSQSLGEVESKKTVSDLLSPLTGVVRTVNEAAEADPSSLNREPYETWILELECPDFSQQVGALMGPSAYGEYLAARG